MSTGYALLPLRDSSFSSSETKLQSLVGIGEKIVTQVLRAKREISNCILNRLFSPIFSSTFQRQLMVPISETLSGERSSASQIWLCLNFPTADLGFTFSKLTQLLMNCHFPASNFCSYCLFFHALCSPWLTLGYLFIVFSQACMREWRWVFSLFPLSGNPRVDLSI